jgi:hypothetical protein
MGITDLIPPIRYFSSTNVTRQPENTPQMATDYRKCPKCKHSNPAHYSSCGGCGGNLNPLTASSLAPAAPPKEKSSSFRYKRRITTQDLIIIGASALFFAGAGAMLGGGRAVRRGLDSGSGLIMGALVGFVMGIVIGVQGVSRGQ